MDEQPMQIHARLIVRLSLTAAIAVIPSLIEAADLTTPKSAAKSFYAAVAAGDERQVRDCMLVDGDQQEKLASSMVDLILAGKKLGDAAKEKFGANGGKLSAEAITKEDAARIDQATETDDGDDAHLQVSPNGQPLTFHKTSDGWKLVITDYAGGKAANIPAQIELLSNLAAAMNDTTQEITEGKFPTSADAETALRQRFSEVMVNHYKPATQPSTAPSAK